ncbi:MAG TPA: GNAT family N-acetyltransferase [Bacteroidota bacterium]|nr:GNAT family N-acetyltransferase [Bacteroidota bacterium]
MLLAPEHILTSRLLLRKAQMKDAPAIFQEYAQDAEVTRYLTWKPDRTLTEVEEFLGRCIEHWRRGSSFTWAITLRDSSALVGMIEGRIDAYMINVGYVLGRAHWNRGYATEAVKAICQWAEGEAEVFRIWAVCAVDNPASARVLEKAGMTREGILHRWAVMPNISGTPQDCYCYARIKEAAAAPPSL